ncbi:hypothetical protein D6D04_06072 [Aureobasidium pullulans]|nr:hypothetical protein D6D04_06072 [Aureobasidium pullulans]
MIAKHLELPDDAIKITETYVNDPSRNHIESNIRLARNFFAIFMTALPENWEAEVENDGFIDDEVEEEGSAKVPTARKTGTTARSMT